VVIDPDIVNRRQNNEKDEEIFIRLSHFDEGLGSGIKYRDYS
jgi:hypothetical protein